MLSVNNLCLNLFIIKQECKKLIITFHQLIFQRLPKLQHPVLNLALQGATVCCTGFEKQKRVRHPIFIVQYYFSVTYTLGIAIKSHKHVSLN